MPDYQSRLAILRATLRKSPVSKDVDLAYLAGKTDSFSGADLVEICQTTCRLAIREDIVHEAVALAREEEFNEYLEDESEFLPELLPRHFEEAVRNARRSVSDRDLAQYSLFAKSLEQSRGALMGPTGRSLANFAFPQRAGLEQDESMDGDDLYS
eukprot:775428_1